ncbi:hypothetical protein HHTV1_6 [Haloarcula hispanica tailed virus 1]|uniref:Uncharacterized protein n=1 Tax=Haloarcula hispanica tailed virus 1 TaxID=1273750 RepID=R4TKQ9_9CAUD|nr:hypothetical protein M198_gp06 [Haloarcula hispanica tailed virus 1]AGM11262.1 hypothetical protein HHTV1_6 [Haloarcula hispanica tailed virus 1]
MLGEARRSEVPAVQDPVRLVAPEGADLMASSSTCIGCGDQFEHGDRIVRMDVIRVVDHPGDPDAGWGSPFEGGLRPSEESADRQYVHLGCIEELGDHDGD